MYYPLIGHIAFWVLIIWGWAADGLTLRVRLVFLALWVAGYVGFPHLPNGDWWFNPYVAVLDIIILMIVARDNAPVT